MSYKAAILKFLRSRLHSSTKEDAEISHSQAQPPLLVRSSVTDVASKEPTTLDVGPENRNDLSFEDESARQWVDNGACLLLFDWSFLFSIVFDWLFSFYVVFE